MCSLPFTTGAKSISLSGFSRRARTGSHRKNLIFAPCAAYHGVFYACTFGGFCAILQKTARLSHTVLLLQLIPARGRKPRFHDWKPSQRTAPFQLIPARGRKRVTKLLNCHAPNCFNLSPRGDGNVSFSIVRMITSAALQLIPARGRKRSIGHITSMFEIGCNLSPRGDGNLLKRYFKPFSMAACNLSPRGDRNILSSKDKIGYNEATGISPKRRNAYTDLCENFPYLPR